MSFPIVVRQRVRFRDCDSLGHVNNAVYLTYLEEARVELLERFAMSWTDMILARCEIDFRDQVSVGEVVEVSLWPIRVGNKSFELGYELKVDERLVAAAKTVLVAYDYETNQSRPVPEAWRKLLSE